ncbi:hypothetical protein A0256_01650 [Mucilaginibacter sp. PAMC 26640]|nr:hypothetical protein A0256_01650 [Mucilaginibacter sp. PAMC 26640]
MNNIRVRHVLYFSIAAYAVIVFSMVLKLSQGIGWDPAINMRMVYNASKHIPFNYLSHPNPANLNLDELEFVAWWTPAQYALPMLVQNLLNVNISIAIKIVTATSLLFSGWGIFKLFSLLCKSKDEDIDDTSANLALMLVLFTLLQPFFWRSLLEYDGGVVLLNTYCPWFFYGVAKIKRVNGYSLAALLLAAFVGFFLKAAFTSIFAGALFYLFIRDFSRQGGSLKMYDLKKGFFLAVKLAALLLVYIVAIKSAFLNHNNNIGTSSLGIRLQPRVFAFPVDAPVLGLFMAFSLNKTLQWLIALIVIVPFYYLIFFNKKISLSHRLMLLGFVPATVFFYMLLYFIDVDVSYELRHFIPVTILITPAFFIGVRQLPFGKVLMYGVICLFSCLNIYQFINRARTTAPEGPSILYSGLQLSYPADLVEKIHSLDNQNKQCRDIFYMQSGAPSLALEIKNNRVLLEDNYINFHFLNAQRFKPKLYFGRNRAALYVVYSNQNFKQDSTKFLTRFGQYTKFQKIFQTKGYVILKGIPAGY